MSASKVRSGPSNRRRVLGYAAQIALLLSVYLLVSAWQTRGHLSRGASVAPDFKLRSLTGKPVQLSDFRGKMLVLHFWATWCGVCKLEIGALNALAASLSSDQVLLSVVADGDDPERVREFVREHDIAYPVVLADARVLKDYGISAFPTTYFLDSDGKIASSSVGLSNRFAYRARMGCAR